MSFDLLHLINLIISNLIIVAQAPPPHSAPLLRIPSASQVYISTFLKQESVNSLKMSCRYFNILSIIDDNQYEYSHNEIQSHSSSDIKNQTFTERGISFFTIYKKLTALNNNQLSHFCNKLPKLFDNNSSFGLFTNALFAGFSKYRSEISLNSFKQIISTLNTNNIQHNDISSLTIQDSVPLCMCDLPQELINEFTSYLKLEEFIAFEQTSRKNYIASNSPNKLNSLNLFLFRNNYKIPHLISLSYKYSLLKALSVDLESLSYELARDRPHTFTNLQTLTLNTSCASAVVQVEQLIKNHNIINLSNIEQLTLVHHYCSRRSEYNLDNLGIIVPDHTLITFASLTKILQNCSNLQALRFGCLWLTDRDAETSNIHNVIDQCTISKMFTKLTMLHFTYEYPEAHGSNPENITEVQFINKIIKVKGPSLQSLSIANPYVSIDLAKGFPKLIDLCLSRHSIDTTQKILNSVGKSLKRIFIDSPEISKNQYDVLKNLIVEIVRDKEDLEYIGIGINADWYTGYDNTNKIMKSVNSALMETSNVKDALKIEYVLHLGGIIRKIMTVENIKECINAFVWCLEGSHISNYILDLKIVSSGLNFQVEDYDNAVSNIMIGNEWWREDVMVFSEIGIYTCNVSKKDRSDCIRCLISNKNCNINAYDPHWIHA